MLKRMLHSLRNWHTGLGYRICLLVIGVPLHIAAVYVLVISFLGPGIFEIIVDGFSWFNFWRIAFFLVALKFESDFFCWFVPHDDNEFEEWTK